MEAAHFVGGAADLPADVEGAKKHFLISHVTETTFSNRAAGPALFHPFAP